MKPTELRTLIKESIQEYIREVETSGNIAAQEAKVRACEEAIALREKKINMEGLDEAYHDMIDEAKKKNLEKEIKELQKYKSKAEKLLEKMKTKAEGKTAPKQMEDEGMDEAVIDEVSIDELTADPNAGPQLEDLDEAKKKPSAGMTKKEKSALSKKAHAGKDIGKKGKGFEKVAKAGEKQYGSKEAGEKVAAAAMWKAAAKKESVETEGEVLNESFLHMQKLAGLITEAEYQKKRTVLAEITLDPINQELKDKYIDAYLTLTIDPYAGEYDLDLPDYNEIETHAKKYGYEKTLDTIAKHPDVTALRQKYARGIQDDPLASKAPGTNVGNLMMRDPLKNLTKKGKMSKLDVDRLKMKIKQNLGI